MRGIKDKSAIVTGGSQGIGRACVERLCAEGCSVVFSGLSEKGVTTERELRAKGWNAHFVRGDMADETFCRLLVAKTIERLGTIHFLINNAFAFTSKGLKATREDWERVLNAGPVAYATMIQLVAPYMRAAGGAIINMSSISAHIAQANRWTYNAAKGAVNQLTRCAAMDLAPTIRVNTLSPGFIWTSEVAKAVNYDRQKWEPVWGKFHLLRRVGNVEECAAAAAFLLSDEASFIAGTELMVDGGYSAMGSEGLCEGSAYLGSA